MFVTQINGKAVDPQAAAEYLEKYAKQPDVLNGKKRLNHNKCMELYEESKKYIPGGMSAARTPTEFIPGEYPVFLVKGKGAHIWDTDGNEYIDYMAGFGPTTIGIAIDEIDKVVADKMKDGICFGLSHPIQIELAKKINQYFPCAERTLLCKTGTDATVIATKVARAYTGKELILTDGFHGWGDFSQYGEDDGVLKATQEKTIHIKYGDYEAYEEAVKKGNVALIMVTPYPAGPLKRTTIDIDFITKIRKLCDDYDIPLAFDEVRTAFRFAMGGAAEMIGIQPDITCFGKAFANGYSIAAVGGKAEIMEAVSIGAGRKGGTYISSTYFPNTLEMYAALETIRFYEEKSVVTEIYRKGKYLIDGLEAVAKEVGAPMVFDKEATMPGIMFDIEKVSEEEFFAMTMTLYTYMIRSGILMHPFRQLYIAYSLTDEDLKKTIQAFKEGLMYLKDVYAW